LQYSVQLLILCPLIFFASFVDAIAGGGGLISLPAYMLTGIPMHMVYGSNKLSACIGTTAAAASYWKSGRIHLKASAVAAALALVGSAAGSHINLMIDADLLKTIVLVSLPVVAVIVLFGSKNKTADRLMTGRRLYLLSAASGFFIGIYDGLIGPGTGTFLIFCFTGLAGFDYVTASGNAKVVNWASNFASLIVFLFAGQVNFALALPAAAASVLGGLTGSRAAILKGNKFIKYVLVAVLCGIFVKLGTDVLL